MTNLPAYLQHLPSRNLAQTAIANVGAGNPPYLSIEGGRFTVIDAAGEGVPIETLYVDCIIVDVNAHASRVYYDPSHPYNPQNPSRLPPLCFSDNGQAPSILAGTPQHSNCGSCPRREWSRINQLGNKVPWCTEYQKIALLTAKFPQMPLLLRIPPNSKNNWRAYTGSFAQHGIDLDRVITRISFEAGQTGTLEFATPTVANGQLAYIPESFVPIVQKIVESKVTDAIVGKLDQPRQAALAAPTPAQEFQPSPLPAQPAGSLPPTSQPMQTSPQAPAGFGTPAQDAAIAQTIAEPQRRRRGRQPAAQAQPAPNRGPMQPAPQMAPFRPEAAQQPFQASQGSTAQPGQFGIVQNPPAPPEGLDLDAVFK